MNEDLCRSCGRHEGLQNITAGSEASLKLLVCTSIEIKDADDLPKMLCNDCEEDLDFCYSFRLRAIETERKLRQMLQAKNGLIHRENLADVDLNNCVGNTNGSLEDNDFEENEVKPFQENPKNLRGFIDDLPSETNNLSSFNEVSKDIQTKIEQMDDIVLENDIENEEPEVKMEFNDSVCELGDNVGKRIFENTCAAEEENGIENKEAWNAGHADDGPHVIDMVEILSSDEEDEDKNEGSFNDEADFYFFDESEESDDESVKEDLAEADEKDFKLEENEEETEEEENEDIFIDALENIEPKSSVETGESNLNVSRYTCHTCNAEFEAQNDYRVHIRMHGDKRFYCFQCEKYFSTLSRLKQHELTHTCPKDQGVCKECGKVYRTFASLKRHYRAHHENNSEYTCSICRSSFSRKDVLNNHMETHKKDEEYLCPKCPLKTKHKRYLHVHLKKHDAKEELQKKNSLNVNKSSEKPKKTHYCVHCGKVSEDILAHKSHMRTHTKELPFKCETCSKAFSTMAALISHEYTHTDSRPYQCEYCLVSFRQAAHLKEHKLTHTGSLPHVCDICGKAFAKKWNMTVHKQRHIKDNSFICRICRSSFLNLPSLRSHAETIHKLTVEDVRLSPEESKEFTAKILKEASDSIDHDNDSSVYINDDLVDVKIKTDDDIVSFEEKVENSPSGSLIQSKEEPQNAIDYENEIDMASAL